MRVVVQRSKNASVTIDGIVHGKIDYGLVVFVGFTDTDTIKEIDYMVNKIINLRIFNDDNGIMNLSIKDVGGSILSISQFTLYAVTNKGNRPSYIKAMKGEDATKLYDIFNEKLKTSGIMVEKGIFGSDMKVELLNDGPVTILIDTKEDSYGY